MSKLVKQPSYVGKTATTYLNEISVDIDVIEALGQQTDDSGNSVDWGLNNTGNWYTVANGVETLCKNMENKGLGIYDNVNYIFTFRIMYYSKFQTTGYINLCTLDISNLFNGHSFGNAPTTSDQERLDDLFNIRKQLEECQSVLNVLASSDSN